MNKNEGSYSYEGMKKVTYEEAISRFNENLNIYLLFDDNTESLVESIDEILDHEKNSGEFGYE